MNWFSSSTVENMLAQILGRLNRLEGMMSALDTAIANLTTQVTNEISVEQSAITLIQGLAAELTANANDPAAVQALADKIQASATSLAAAVAANQSPTPPTTGA